MWKKCLDCIDELLDILFEHNNIFIGENIAEDSENLANTDQVPRLLFFYTAEVKASIEHNLFIVSLQQNFVLCVYQPFRVRGCILTLVERMDEEFTKIMQNTDPHSQGKND